MGSMLTRVYVRFTSFAKNILHGGIENQFSADLSKTIYLTNCISFTAIVLFFLSFIVLSSIITLSLVIALSVQCSLHFLVLCLNRAGHHRLARHVLMVSLTMLTFINTQMMDTQVDFELGSFAIVGLPIILFGAESVLITICYELLNMLVFVINRNNLFYFIPLEWRMVAPKWVSQLSFCITYTFSFLTMLYFYLANRTAESKLVRTYIKLARTARMSTLGEMAGGMAHEINNPLAIIIGKIQLEKLTAKAKSDSNLKESKLLDDLEANAQRIHGVTKSLLLFSSGLKDSSLKTESISRNIELAIDVCKPVFTEFGIRLDVHIAESLELFYCETDLSETVLNLLLNACEATKKLDDRWVKVEATSNSTTIQIQVTDSGTIFDSVTREKMFDPFFTTDKSGKGMGMGLSIAKGIVESHHGTVGLNLGSPNTQFQIDLPIKYFSRKPIG